MSISVTPINSPTNLVAPRSMQQPFQNSNNLNTENSHTKPSNDRVTLSPEAQKLNSGYLQTNPHEIVAAWKKDDHRITLPGEKPFDELKPENQSLINKFKQEMETASQDRRGELRARISLITSYGDKEVFKSEYDVLAKKEAVSEAINIVMKDVIKNPDKYNITIQTVSESEPIPKLGQLINSDTSTKSEQSVHVDLLNDMIRKGQSDLFSFILESKFEK